MANDYQDALKKETNYTGNTVDYYNALRNESYKALQDASIQASVSKQQAMKYAQNSLRNAGLANQGIAQSTSLGINNQYQQALANANSQYRNDILGINKEQRAEELANAETRFGSLQDNIQAITDDTNLTQDQKNEAYTKVLQNYGLTTDGNYQVSDYGNSGLGSVSAEVQSYLDALKNENGNGTVNIQGENGTTISYQIGDLKEIGDSNTYSAYNGSGVITTINKDRISKELDTIKVGSYKDGSVFAIYPNNSQSQNDMGKRVYALYSGGKLYYISKEDFEKAKNKYYVGGNKVRTKQGSSSIQISEQSSEEPNKE